MIKVTSTKNINDVTITNSIEIGSEGTVDTNVLEFIMDKLGMKEQSIEVEQKAEEKLNSDFYQDTQSNP